jgi:xanthine dehydrogenase accessory factor
VTQGVTYPLCLEHWFIEPLLAPTRPIWIYGAGHVGRALISVLADLPDLAITWVDTSTDRFPQDIPARVTPLVAADPCDVVRYAPPEAEHLVLTYSHKMDLEICHALLGHGFRYAGLIGSATKWARFRTRLAHLGHDQIAIDQIACPIGQPAYGKHPQAIAIGVAADLLAMTVTQTSKKERRA